MSRASLLLFYIHPVKRIDTHTQADQSGIARKKEVCKRADCKTGEHAAVFTGQV
jgi:hypothetical protein